MPIHLGDLSRDTRTIEVEWEGDKFNLTYRPSNYTPAMESIFVRNLKSDLPGNAFAQVLSELLVSWDVLDEDGNEIGHDFETLETIYTAFLAFLFNSITDDLSSAREDRKNFGSGSKGRAKAESARRGTR